jgi:hypothetical protein
VLARKLHRQLRLAYAAKAMHNSDVAAACCALCAKEKPLKLLHLGVSFDEAVYYWHASQAEVDFVFASICCT